MKAVTKSIRISPKKLNLVATLIRGKKADEALGMLEYTPKKGARILHDAVKSAVANATNNFKQDRANLFIKEVVVNKAASYKRWVPASRGRMHPVLKRNSNLTITIGVSEEAKKTAKTTTKTAKTEEAKPAPKKAAAKKAPAKKETAKTTKSSKA